MLTNVFARTAQMAAAIISAALLTGYVTVLSAPVVTATPTHAAARR